jgi:hypothetical protein
MNTHAFIRSEIHFLKIVHFIEPKKLRHESEIFFSSGKDV